MSARSRETFLIFAIVALSVFFSHYAKGKVPDSLFNAVLVASTMLMSVSLYGGADYMLNMVSGKGWSYTKNLIFEPQWESRFRGFLIFFALMMLTNRVIDHLKFPGYMSVFLGIAVSVAGINMLFLPIFTRIVLGAVSVNRYFDSLATPPFVSPGERQEDCTSKSEDMIAHIKRIRKKEVASIFGVFGVGFIIALMPRANPMFAFKVGIVSYPAFICVDVFLCAFVAAFCFFGKIVNQHFALCGAKYEQAFLNHSLRDEDMFEMNRTMARQVKKAAIIFAVVVYPTIFYALYMLLSSQ